MNTADIKTKINQKRQAIERCGHRIRQLEEQLDDLDDLRRNVDKLQDNLAWVQKTRRLKLGDVEVWQVNTKITGPYTSGMRNMLNNTQYIHAYSGLDDAKRQIARKRNSIEDEINDLKRTICICRGEIYELKDLLIKMQEKEVGTVGYRDS